MRFRLGEVSLCFVCVHLTAHDNNVAQRNADIRYIDESLRFPRVPEAVMHSHEYAVAMTSPPPPARRSDECRRGIAMHAQLRRGVWRPELPPGCDIRGRPCRYSKRSNPRAHCQGPAVQGAGLGIAGLQGGGHHVQPNIQVRCGHRLLRHKVCACMVVAAHPHRICINTFCIKQFQAPHACLA